jgi:nitrite reductase/ring-hydroxylating ferredoxin subunit/uncharacterized membrane protein
MTMVVGNIQAVWNLICEEGNPMAQSLVDRIIAQQKWLEGAGDVLQTAINKAVQQGNGVARRITDALNGTWFGHPLHPALSDLPIGLWSGALLLDLSGVQQGADILVGMGIAGATATALAGLTDWKDTYGLERSVGLAHGLLNTAALLMYGASLGLRLSGKRGRGVALSTLGYATTLVSSYLGGDMVFGKGTAVNHAAWQAQPEDYTSVMAESALEENRPIRAMAGDTPILLVKRDGQIFAMADTCTHAGGPLSEGTLEGDSIVCPWHGSRFCIRDGRVQGGPATMPEVSYAVRVRNGQIEVKAAG